MSEQVLFENQPLDPRIVEALVFASDEPLSLEQIAYLIYTGNLRAGTKNKEKSFDPSPEHVEHIRSAIEELNRELQSQGRPYEIVEVAGGVHFATRADYGRYVQRLLVSKSRKRLSQAALETLAIVAYRQPITKPEIDEIRGVNSSEVVNSLVEKGLVAIAGRSEQPGKPLLYKSTTEFLRLFGINSLGDLPKLREIEELLEKNAQSIFTDISNLAISTEFDPEQLEESQQAEEEKAEMAGVSVTQNHSVDPMT